MYKLKYASLPYQTTVRGPSSQSPLTRRHLKFMTDKKILLNFVKIRVGDSEQPWTWTHKEWRWNGLWYDEKETTSSIHGVPSLNKISWYKRGNILMSELPPTTPKENILKYSCKYSVNCLNCRHLNFAFLSVPCWMLHKNKKFAVHVYFIQHLQFCVQRQMEMFHKCTLFLQHCCVMWEMKKYYLETRSRGISYMK
jgi:hypothetical protein